MAIFKSVKHHNRTRSETAPKLYLVAKWYEEYDLSKDKKLDLNTIQYISDEIDACDENVVSVKDYMQKPAEMFGVNDRALMERINLIRTTPFHRLPEEIRADLRECFRLHDDQFIDLRSHIIKRLEREVLEMNSKAIFNRYPNGDEGSWIFGNGPKHHKIVGDLMSKIQQLRNVEDGEILDDMIQREDKRKLKNNKNKKRSRSAGKSGKSGKYKGKKRKNDGTSGEGKTFETRGFQERKSTKSSQKKVNWPWG